MKYRNGLVKKAAAFLLGLAMTVVNMTVVNAATAPDLDLTKTGSIALTLKDADGVTVSGGAVTAYEVAKLYLDDGNMAYEFTAGFSGCTVTLDVTDTTLASSLVSYMSGKTITGTEKSVASDGTVSFTDLELGLYLIVQTIGSEEYEAISPFVVTLPMEEDSVWVYTVNASPKVGTVTLTPEEPEEPAEPTEPEEPEEPAEPETPQTPAEPILPQTGQLNWPIPILVIGGLVLLIAGFYLKNTDKKNRHYAS